MWGGGVLEIFFFAFHFMAETIEYPLGKVTLPLERAFMFYILFTDDIFLI